MLESPILYLKVMRILMFQLSGFCYRGFTVPRGSYPTPFLGYLVLWLGSPILKSRYLKKGVGYDPIGKL